MVTYVLFISIAVFATVVRMWSSNASAHVSAMSDSLFFSEEQSTTYTPARTRFPEDFRMSSAKARYLSISDRNWSKTVGSPFLPVGSVGTTTLAANAATCDAMSRVSRPSCGAKTALSASGASLPRRIAVASRVRASTTSGSSSWNVSIAFADATFTTPGRGMPIAASTAPSRQLITASSKASNGGENSAHPSSPGWSLTTNNGSLDQRSVRSSGSQCPCVSG